MNANAMDESVAKIDRYARSEGATWMVVQESRVLPIEKPPVNLDKSHVVGPAATLMRLTEIIDALDAVAIDMDAEVLETQSSLDYIWGN